MDGWTLTDTNTLLITLHLSTLQQAVLLQTTYSVFSLRAMGTGKKDKLHTQKMNHTFTPLIRSSLDPYFYIYLVYREEKFYWKVSHLTILMQLGAFFFKFKLCFLIDCSLALKCLICFGKLSAALNSCL